MRLSSFRTLLAALPLALAAPAAASDGVLQINAACAVQTGCFTGDTAGYPITIASPSSYVLTGNLVVPDANTTGIEVSTPGVHIDLNGFQIVRAGCEDETVSCTPVSGSGRGVTVTSSELLGISVENGGVIGMGAGGVYLGPQSIATRLSVRWNRVNGIQVGAGSIVSGNTVYRSSNNGIAAGPSSAVSGNVARLNGGSGITCGAGSTVAGNTVTDNGGAGVLAADGSSVSGNIARSNSFYGFFLDVASTYRENTVTNNTPGAVFDGINRGDNYCQGPGVVSDLCP